VRGSLIVLLAALLAAEPKGAVPSANVGWRFDGNGHFPDIRPVAEWDENKHVLWKTVVRGGGYSSPIVVSDRVFVTAEMGSLICLDLADGIILWSKDLFGEASKDIPANLSRKLMRGCGGDSKQSTPTPASNGELVFYINAMGLCACYDLRGNLQWIRIVETAEDEEYFTSSPIFLGDRIILSWGCLLALDAKDGHTLWKAPNAKAAHGSAVIARLGGEDMAITPAGDIVRVADGQILASGLFQTKYATPLVEGNVLYVIDAQARAFELPAKAGGNPAIPAWAKTGVTDKMQVFAYDARTGKVVWKFEETCKPGTRGPGLIADSVLPLTFQKEACVLIHGNREWKILRLADGTQVWHWECAGPMEAPGLLVQAVETFDVEGMDGVADRNGGAAEVAGDQGGTMAGGTGQQDLATAQSKGIGGAQAGLQTTPSRDTCD